MQAQQQKCVSNLVLVCCFFFKPAIKVTMQLFCYGPLCRNFFPQLHTPVVSNAFVNP